MENYCIVKLSIFEKYWGFWTLYIYDIYQKNPKFWTDVFNAYRVMFNKVQPLNSLQILAEPVCFNERIQVGNKVISYKQWVVHGVRRNGRFITEDGDFLSHAQFNRKFNLNTAFLTYGGCKQPWKPVYVRLVFKQMLLMFVSKSFSQLEKDPDKFMMSWFIIMNNQIAALYGNINLIKWSTGDDVFIVPTRSKM